MSEHKEYHSKSDIYEQGKRIALVVGVENSLRSKALPSLKYAEADATGMAQVLTQNCNFELFRTPLLNSTALSNEVKQAILEMANEERGDQDVLLFYFSGHGQPITVNGRRDLYLVTCDFNERDSQRDPSMHVSLRWLRQNLFEYQTAGSVVIILDCCYAGNIVGAMSDPLQIDLRQAIEDSLSGVSFGEGLEDRLRVVLTASGYNQKTFEAEGHGLMTGMILSALSGSEHLALDREGNITIKSLHDFLEKQYLVRKLNHTPYLLGHITRRCVLASFPDHVLIVPDRDEKNKRQREDALKREQGLQALLIDHHRFLKDRLASFVGRRGELAEIRQRINDKLLQGGYITITGQAGQGKSSIIAKMVEQAGSENIAYHFIPFNPGPDHQVSLLRNLMARLILKYELSDIYVASESRPVLQDFFSKVLTEVSAKGGQEVIFIDGLDQLQEDPNGERDLSFLPTSLPIGVVCVLGTRPNDTLKPLELLKPHIEYRLPDISRNDFDLILEHRGVDLEKSLVDRFYSTMQANALYLDLVAKELAEVELADPAEIIKQLSDNPENIFSLTLDRLKRQRHHWRDVIKPVLGLLLASCEPLGQKALRDLIEVDGHTLREGLQKLGGLIVQDGRERYHLFHLKLQDYLRQDEIQPNKNQVFDMDEEEMWHARLATWCTDGWPSGLELIWRDIVSDHAEQERRLYAREHSITHLYLSSNFEALWQVIDEGLYGKAKIQFDPSTRSYARDLDLACRALIRIHGEEGNPYLLLKLWRYILLRSSMTSKIRYYPEELFTLLVLKERIEEAIELVDVLPKAQNKAMALCRIGQAIAKYRPQNREALSILQRAEKIAHTITNSWDQASVLWSLTKIIAECENWEEAINMAYQLGDSRERVEALAMVAEELAINSKKEAFTQLIERISRLARFVGYEWRQEKTFYDVKDILNGSKDWHEALPADISKSNFKDLTKSKIILAKGLIGTGNNEAVKYVLSLADSQHFKVDIKLALARQLAKSQQYLATSQILEKVISLVQMDIDVTNRVEGLITVVLLYSKIGDRTTAMKLLSNLINPTYVIDDFKQRSSALIAVAEDFADLDDKASASYILIKAAENSRIIKEKQERSESLKAVADSMFRIGKQDEAGILYNESGGAPLAIQDSDLEDEIRAYNEGIKVYERVGNQEKADQFRNDYLKDSFLEKLVMKGRWKDAIEFARMSKIPQRRIGFIVIVARCLVQMNEKTMAFQFLGEAVETVRSIPEGKDQAEACISIIEVAADLNELDMVLPLLNKVLIQIDTFNYPFEKVEMLYKLALPLIKLRQDDSVLSIVKDAQRITPGIRNNRERIEALRMTAKILAKNQNRKYLISLILKYWPEATTRDEALKLLPIISGLIAHNHELIPEIISSLSWVDEFLRVE